METIRIVAQRFIILTAAAVVPIRGILSQAETDTREPLSQVFSLVAGGRVKIQKRGSCEVTTGT